jgi:predicted dehydrogenase
MDPLSVGVIGCGNISGIYLDNLAAYPETEVVALADLDLDRAAIVATARGIGRVLTPEQLLNDEAVDLVLNLTVPKAHAEINLAAVEAGKHVYTEKPFALTTREGRMVLEAARRNGRFVGGAPDTFLGAGIQACVDAIDQGLIGDVVAANAFMMCHGHESWHPSPEFYYEVGGGPMFDMGPYYLTALVALIGPIRSVQAMTRITFPERTITSEPKQGQKVPVETPTHLAALLEFENGAIGQITTSFDIWHHTMPHLEIYGTDGSLRVPDPNGFGGEVWVRRAGDAEWNPVQIGQAYSQNSRGLGVRDMAYALCVGRAVRAGGELAYHVLDAMEAVVRSGERGERVTLESWVERPARLAGEPFANG